MPDRQKIKRIMKERGISQAELGRLAGIDQANISTMISKSKNIRERTLVKICHALNCKAEDIWNDSEDAPQ